MGLDKSPNDVTKEDLQELVDTGRSEDRTVEYKARIDSDKKEFLADLTSFSNTEGGFLLLGVEENSRGEPTNLCGVNYDDIDKCKQDISNLIRDCVEPQLPNIDIQPVLIGDNRHVVVIWIGSSLLGPHMVKKGRGRFFRRHSAGKEPFDVATLRSAFLRSATFAERARNWRQERIQALVDGSQIQFPSDGPIIILHVVPLAAFEAGTRVDVTGIPGAGLAPLGGSVNASRYNFEGLLTVYGPDYATGQVRSYAQFYRSGCIESAHALQLDGSALLPIVDIEKDLIDTTKRYIESLRELSVSPPAAVMVSFLDVHNYRVPHASMSPQPEIDRAELPIPEVLIDRFDEWRDDWLRAAFDTIWNAGGHQACPHFTEDGTWDPNATRV